MITCNECLKALSTSRLSEIRSGSPVATHYSTCDACRRVVQDLQYAESGLAMVLDQFGPRATPQSVARHAADSMLRRRRRIARVARGALAIIAVGVLAAGLEAIVGDDRTVSHTMALNCLSSERALEIIQPFAAARVSISSTGQGRTVRLQGEEADVVEAAARIAVADRSGSCAVPPGQDKEPEASATPQADKGGTD